MTNNIDIRLKIQEELFKYLFKLGYPHITDEHILREVPNMWKHLNSVGLITPEMSYQSFYESAVVRYNIKKTMNW